MPIFLGAVLIGMIFGFVLVEEKDDNTINAMLVTPLPLNQYLAYRVGMPAGIAFVEVIVAALITNLAVPPLWQLVLIAAGASLAAPITGLYFAAFAENKVQGLALTKFVGRHAHSRGLVRPGAAPVPVRPVPALQST